MKSAIFGIGSFSATVLALSGAAHAHDDHGDARVARSLAANCAACHGTNGKAQDAMPVLAGKSREFIVERLQDFKTGKREATVMHQISKGYTDAQIGAVAEYFSKQK